MKLVKENINFERGREPKKAMGVGMSSLKKANYVQNRLKEMGIEARLSDNSREFTFYTMEDEIGLITKLQMGIYYVLTDKWSVDGIEYDDMELAIYAMTSFHYGNTIDRKIAKREKEIEQLKLAKKYLSENKDFFN